MVDIEQLVSDRVVFNAFVYTPVEEALKTIESRRNDSILRERVLTIIPNDIPDVLRDRNVAILFRHVATPNYEIRRFISIVDAIGGIDPLFWEYHSDKFTSNNELKHALGKMSFFFGNGKKGGQKINRHNIINFNSENGKKIKEICTVWNESLIDFHHNLFALSYPKLADNCFFDASEWFKESGGSAKEYYIKFLALFIQNGILFENFMLDEKEREFTKTVFLPAFISVWELTGVKPLIVALEPTEIEGDNFWVCYPSETERHITEKLEI